MHYQKTIYSLEVSEIFFRQTQRERSSILKVKKLRFGVNQRIVMITKTIPKLFLDRECAESKVLTKEDVAMVVIKTKALLESMIRDSADNGDDSVIRRWNYYYYNYHHKSNYNNVDTHNSSSARRKT